jgi:hypothetical protein
MSIDALEKRPGADRVDLNNPVEVRRWIEEFGVSFHQLRDAVMKAGPTRAAVEVALREISDGKSIA